MMGVHLLDHPDDLTTRKEAQEAKNWIDTTFKELIGVIPPEEAKNWIDTTFKELIGVIPPEPEKNKPTKARQQQQLPVREVSSW
ncbi:hypothetical protein TSOC_005965 [Tetrabaena socialis]|uniref:Uncharacterized protein n=1 Tax=Tetrabaena socialis TaxID=47790 RepID=A0A2J8A4X9_9CHLO|nr:hypothetical protein TSOC_005965 [Tetrabaena socialis]|eukprot:PNH07570.1 hypothetical protein TSOC_005965 [Tetrabaena socialis]